MPNSWNLHAQFLFPKCSYEFKMAYCSAPTCWCCLGSGLHRSPGSWQAKPRRSSCKSARDACLESHTQAGQTQERARMDMGTFRPASSRNPPRESLYLTDTPCFHPQSQGRSSKAMDMSASCRKVLCSESRTGERALCSERVSNGNHWLREKESLPSFKF